MKKSLLPLSVVLSVILAGCALLPKDDKAQVDYQYNQELPLNVGNTWSYQVTRYDGFNPNDTLTAASTVVDTITNVELKEGFFVATVESERTAETLVEVQGNYPAADSLQPATSKTYWLIVDGDRILRQDEQLNLSDLQSQVMVQFVFPIDLNSQWSMTNAEDAPPNQKVTKVGSINVPAGTFDDGFYLEGNLGGMVLEEWFCPGVGVVWSKTEHQGTPSGSKQELISYTVK